MMDVYKVQKTILFVRTDFDHGFEIEGCFARGLLEVRPVSYPGADRERLRLHVCFTFVNSGYTSVLDGVQVASSDRAYAFF